MAVILYTTGEFESPSNRRQNLEWIHLFQRSMIPANLSVTFFDPKFSIISTSDVVHVFGFIRPENWYWIRKLCKRVIVTPFPYQDLKQSHKSPASVITYSLHRLFKGATAADAKSVASVDYFLTFSHQEARLRLLTIPENKIVISKLDHDDFQVKAHRLYEKNER